MNSCFSHLRLLLTCHQSSSPPPLTVHACYTPYGDRNGRKRDLDREGRESGIMRNKGEKEERGESRNMMRKGEKEELGEVLQV